MPAYRTPAVGLLAAGLLALAVACAPRAQTRVDADAAADAGRPADPLARVEDDVRFLAADELLGRDTPSPGLEAAADYIAARFRALGLRPVGGLSDFRQPVRLATVAPPAGGKLELAGFERSLGAADDDNGAPGMIALRGGDVAHDGEYAYAPHGTAAEVDALDLAGKVLVTNAGYDDSANPFAMYQAVREKAARAWAAGAVALVELYRNPRGPWRMIAANLGGARMTLAPDPEQPDLPVLWLDDASSELAKRVQRDEGTRLRLRLAPTRVTPVPTSNVVAVVPGTDERLRDQAILLTAHYDHVGTGARPGSADTIFNGARDNALGVAALLAAAARVARAPGKRPVVFAAVTAEEKGLLGSAYFVANPPLPLREIGFNLNLDGAGYDDTTAVTLNGLTRTSAQSLIEASVKTAGLTAADDPVPEQNLYDRSDNVNFARAGIPAVTLAPGFTGFTPELMRYYHQPGDNPESLDYAYVRKYAAAVAELIAALADYPERITWTPGDKYAAAGAELYGADD